MYRMLGGLLAAPPSANLLQSLAAIDVPATRPESDDSMFAAWRRLTHAAGHVDAGAVDDEFHELFIGIGRGELLPYGSWYVSGSIMSTPLARLRSDLEALGIERGTDVREPEDHVACLCEAMSLIIESGDEIPLEVQSCFFSDHVATWMGRFFGDLQRAKSARFYAAVGNLGEGFIALDQQYLALPA